MLLANTALLPLTGDDYSLAFWWLHVAGIAGVLGACIAMAVSKRMSKTAHDVLAPVLTRDPLVAFELGLSPAVHRFVASLEDKDPETRDHVIRTAEMAVRVGEHFRLSARQLRDLGLAALLHDIGKLETPIEILDKPSRLTTEEYTIVKRHAVDGEQMLLAEPALADRRRDRALAPRADRRTRLSRWPHRRHDPARGAHHRRVRRVRRDDARAPVPPARMAPGMAFSVLREHAGSQWDER